MPKSIRVHLLPSLTTPADLAGNCVVVIDVLRATTTIVHALAAGAKKIIPCLEIDEAFQNAKPLGEQTVLGGERHGRVIDGFDLGNSPEEYRPAKVRGKTVIFTTTNGTQAMNVCRHARRVILGAFVNFSAVCEQVCDSDNVDVVCAGTYNKITREDVLLAGAIVDNLERNHPGPCIFNDQSYIAADSWRNLVAESGNRIPLAESLRDTQGGRNLLKIGMEHDIEVAASIDKFTIVPELDVKKWIIRLPIDESVNL